ncbi:MAG: AMP-binding protein [Prevotella sp.]|nr:AMP-binding protein [Candidatus Prevotella equi]
MKEIPSFNARIEEAIKKYWELDALTDYKGATLQYQDVARRIEKLHILFENGGIKKGDKIALCGRNMSNWAVSFLAVVTYGAVAVPILHEFTADQIHNIVNHSEARLLFVGDVVAKQIDPDKMPALEGIINIPDFSLMVSRSDALTESRETLNKLFGEKYPKHFRKDDVEYYKEESPEQLALINYTSGTTGFSKGVMIPYRAMWSNLDFASKELDAHLHEGDNTISILPMAHMYGMAFEFIKEFMTGCHIYYLTRIPSPAVVAQAFTDVKPIVIIAVPLVIEKIIRKKVFPKLSPAIKVLMKTPIVGRKVKEKILKQVYDAFGGKLYEMIVGGAALNQEVEQFLKDIKFPITVGYGATECAPIISYADWKTHKTGSCGRAAHHMEVKIDSKKPNKIPGEILARGLNVMLGYFKNEEATRETIDSEGWYHTGDLGIMDKKGNIFIKGRSKNMLLGPSGQNIFPEEIEDALNSLPMVMESIVVKREEKLVALVHPDIETCAASNMSSADVEALMQQNLKQLNETQPAYCKIASIEIHDEEFEKTPKKSIKRYLYK